MGKDCVDFYFLVSGEWLGAKDHSIRIEYGFYFLYFLDLIWAAKGEEIIGRWNCIEFVNFKSG